MCVLLLWSFGIESIRPEDHLRVAYALEFVLISPLPKAKQFPPIGQTQKQSRLPFPSFSRSKLVVGFREAIWICMSFNKDPIDKVSKNQDETVPGYLSFRGDPQPPNGSDHP